MILPASLFYRTDGYTVGSIKFDLLISENHSIEAQVSEHPIENGATVSDHVRVLPRKGSIVGLVTNHPLTPQDPLPSEFMEKVNRIGHPGWLQSLANQYTTDEALTSKDFEPIARLTPGESNRARNTWELFKLLVAAREPVTIMTGVEKYADVIVTKVSTSREAGTGDSLRFSVDFQEIKFVTLTEIALTATTKAPLPSVPVAKARKGKTGGKQIKKPVTRMLRGKMYTPSPDGTKWIPYTPKVGGT